MSDQTNNSNLPRHAKSDPGAEITMRTRQDGGVTVSFSDGSDDLDVSRREFMRITGVAAATAAMSGASCRNPKDTITPYVDRPEEVRMGQGNYYASVCSGCSSQCGVLVETRAGRPIKIEGNPNHPVSRGNTCARGQAAYRRLYDPDRQRQPLKVGADGAHQNIDWQTLDQTVTSALAKLTDGGGVRILTRTLTGSGQQALLDQLTDALPNAEHYAYDPLTSQAVTTASQLTYDEPHAPHYRFDEAEVIVSLGSDFLGTWLSPVEFTNMFSSGRDLTDYEYGDKHDQPPAMSRLVAFEGYLSLTGSNADDRYRVRYTDLADLAMGLAHTVAIQSPAGNSAIRGALEAFTPQAVADSTGVPADVLTSLAEELIDHQGRSLVVAGGQASSTENGVQLETAVALLNYLLGNVGHTVERGRPTYQAAGGFGDLSRLVDDINAGKVDVVIIDRANPVYSAPPELGIAEALESVNLVVSTSDRVDETATHADYLATGAHALEAWGDSNPYPGVYSIQQPAIRPLYDTRSFEQSLLMWFGAELAPELQSYVQTPETVTELEKHAGDFKQSKQPGDVPTHDPGGWYRYLRDHWKSELYPSADTFAGFDAFWQAVLRKGVWTVPDFQPRPAHMNVAAALDVLPDSVNATPARSPGDLSSKQLHTFSSIPLGDGRLANDGHLQELPDPISKHAWGSYVLVSPKTFQQADLELGDVLAVSVDTAGDTYTREFPVIMQPGMHDDVVAVPLGYGRTQCGVVGADLGANAFDLSHVARSGPLDARQVLSGMDVAIEPTGENIQLTIPQGAQVIDLHERPYMASTTMNAYRQDPEAGVHEHPPLKDLWEDHDYHDLKWGMSIDMTKCTGCNACVTACQEENNIPVVGAQGVREGREMHWMRIDRYYQLPADNPEYADQRNSAYDDPMFADEPYVAFSEYMDNPRVLMQPMLCQHCENAPCETVCPVAATSHSADGLNMMAYNRCVGTRYCSNNCPYKVRRFNWYNYSEDRSDSFLARIFPELKDHARLNVEEPLPLGMNPDVLVRSRGVMEKCTFCVQRIRRAEWQAQEEGRDDVRGDDVITACQQACPAEAIDFGNLLEEQAVVAKNHRSPRAVTPLEEVGTESSIAYLSSVRNTDAEQP